MAVFSRQSIGPAATAHARARAHARGIAVLTIGAVAVVLAIASPVTSALPSRATARTARTRSFVCKGGANSCRAIVSIAGGASREKLRIALSDTDLKLTSVVAKPKTIKGAYQLYGGKYSLGGSLYAVMLNAVRAIPKGATLTFSFAAPRARHAARAR